jgi:hypothetical protein
MLSRPGGLACLFLAVAICASLLSVSPASAGFGFHDFTAAAVNQDGSVDVQAGSHPFAYTVGFTMNQFPGEIAEGGNFPEGTLRDLVVDLPRGLVGNPLAVPRCSGADFEGLIPHCPANTQIGVVHFKVATLNEGFGPIYNLTPPDGVPASVGFSIASNNSFQEASVRSGGDYGVSVSDITVPTKVHIQFITETIWGVPSDSSHDPERFCVVNGKETEGCSSDSAPIPFLSLPTSCTGPLSTTLSVDSLEEPGIFQSQTLQSLGEGGTPAGLSGCARPPFTPSLTVRPETSVADSPTGLHVDLHVPQSQDPNGLATANLKDTIVTLPAGMTVNPSAAAGLGACSPVQVELHGPNPAACPNSSKVGTVQVHTPLVDHPLAGAVYLARQGENPFGSLIALYIAVDDPQTGVVVKLAGKVEPDPVTGQLEATFDENPELPFEDFTLDFTGGPRATLTTPQTCGTYTTTSDLTPWSTPESPDVFPTDAFQIDTAAGGGPCVGSEAQEPNSPSFQAGTATPLAASYSPFVLHLARENGSQHISALNVTMPPGLTGKLAGIARCSDAQLAAATARSNPGEGASELSSPSCPQASEVGTVTVGAGSGSPIFVGGHAYLAGPYKGAPFSLAIITPAVAGPFDLGVVVVRSGLYINPDTAQVTVKSDPIPTILQGIPVDVRLIDVNINRPEFTLNPTSCEPMSIGVQAISTLGQSAPLSSRFQAAGCQGLPFKPSFTASTQGKTSKANGASLTVKVAQKTGEANIHKVALTLPLALPARLTTLQKACTEAQFALNPAGCPPASFIGAATARTPLLDAPLTGPAILVSHGGAAFPDVEFLLQGEGVQITLDGKTDIKKGITHSRFETVPDAPIASFDTVLPQGPHSALAANANLCTSKLAMPTQLAGQNGALVNQTTKIAVTGCPRTLTRAQKLALALKACKKKKGAKRKACERAARKKYGAVKKKK